MTTLNDVIIKQLDYALSKAHCPYSNFRVAACICSSNDILYIGFNIENGSYPCTICAECSAISNFLINRQDENEKITHVYIKAPLDDFITPCGQCRQTLSEFLNKKTLITLVNKDNKMRQHTLDELLPFSFGLDK